MQKNITSPAICLLGVLFLTPLFVSSDGAAADYFVSDASGLDSNDGSLGHPFKTIGKGLSSAQPGDSIYVREGIYDERIDFPSAGIENNRIELKGYEEETAILQYTHPSGYAVYIDQPYITLENLVIEGGWRQVDTVKIRSTGDYCTLKGLTIRNTMRDAIDMSGPTGVLVEDCVIHDAIWFNNGQRNDAHGIVTGGVQNLTIRDTEIYYVSGDALQFQYNGWDNVTVENCLLWNGPLPSARGGAPAEARPGENAIDTKYYASDGRGRLTVTNTIAHGWRSDYISNAAAYNIKHNVDVIFNGTTVYDSEIAFRLRGPASSSKGGAWVTVNNAVVYNADKAVRYEDEIENLKIRHMTFGSGIPTPFQSAGGYGSGFEVLNSLFLAGTKPSVASDTSNIAVDDAVFVDTANHEYKLVAGSLPIDTGVVIPGLVTDRNGVPRPQGRGYDIGAYEYLPVNLSTIIKSCKVCAGVAISPNLPDIDADGKTGLGDIIAGLQILANIRDYP